MAPKDDLTAERAAQLYEKLSGIYDDDDIPIISAALKTARQEALREAAKVCREWHKIDRTNISSVAEMAEVLAGKLDRLASEGAPSPIDLSSKFNDDGGYGEHF